MRTKILQGKCNLFCMINFSDDITALVLHFALSVSVILFCFFQFLPSMHSPEHSGCVFAMTAFTSQPHSFILYIWQDGTCFRPTFFSSLCPPCWGTDGIVFRARALNRATGHVSNLPPLWKSLLAPGQLIAYNHRRSLSLLRGGLCACCYAHV